MRSLEAPSSLLTRALAGQNGIVGEREVDEAVEEKVKSVEEGVFDLRDELC